MISVEKTAKSIRAKTILVAMTAANNETGTLHPISEIGDLCRRRRVPFFVDGLQAYGKITLSPRLMEIPLLSLSAHKYYAPKGVGALYVDDETELAPLIHGGAQEFGLRSGTENVGAIMAFGLASKQIFRERDQENRRLQYLRDYLFIEFKRLDPGCFLIGSEKNRVPNTLCVGFPGVDSMDLLLSLNRIGIYVSTGAAGSAYKGSKTSHVISALGIDSNHQGILRFSLGRATTRENLDHLLKDLPRILH